MLTGTATTSDGLKIDGLSCLRGEARLFSALSVSLARGQGLWLRGPNGSGKSSLLRILAGLLTAEAGSIALNGVAIDRDLTSYRRGIAYLGHLDGLKPNETAREALAFAAKLRGHYSLSSRVKARDPSPAISAAPEGDGFRAFARNDIGSLNALAYLNMASFADTHIRYLSAGQRRRVALASVLASDVKLWLLDEPTTALDEASCLAVYDALRCHLETGGMFVVATHDDPPAIADTKTFILSEWREVLPPRPLSLTGEGQGEGAKAGAQTPSPASFHSATSPVRERS